MSTHMGNPGAFIRFIDQLTATQNKMLVGTTQHENIIGQIKEGYLNAVNDYSYVEHYDKYHRIHANQDMLDTLMYDLRLPFRPVLRNGLLYLFTFSTLDKIDLIYQPNDKSPDLVPYMPGMKIYCQRYGGLSVISTLNNVLTQFYNRVFPDYIDFSLPRSGHGYENRISDICNLFEMCGIPTSRQSNFVILKPNDAKTKLILSGNHSFELHDIGYTLNVSYVGLPTILKDTLVSCALNQLESYLNNLNNIH